MFIDGRFVHVIEDKSETHLRTLMYNLCGCKSSCDSSYLELDVIACLGTRDEYDETFNLGYPIASSAQLSNISFVLFAFFDWRWSRKTATSIASAAVTSIYVAHFLHLVNSCPAGLKENEKRRTKSDFSLIQS